jgi:uncharacterized damage-inducible protein DinB
MPDRKPPRLHGDERQTLHALLQYQRDSVLRKVEDLDETEARQALVESGTTLLWLIKHLSQAESLWVLHRFAGDEVELPDDTVHPEDTVTEAVETYRRTWARVDAVAAGAGLDDLCRNVGDETPVNLRWVLSHLLEETARHAGHADILRELVDGRTGR